MEKEDRAAAQPADWVTVEVDKDFINVSLGTTPGGFSENFIRAAGQDKALKKAAMSLMRLIDPDNKHLSFIFHVGSFRVESLITDYYEWNFVQMNLNGVWLTEEYCEDFKSAYERCLTRLKLQLLVF